MPLLQCDTCSLEFHKPPSQVRAKNFCSTLCRLQWLKINNRQRGFGSVDLVCSWCSKSFVRKVISIWGTGRDFCSKACQNAAHSTLMLTQNPFKGQKHAPESLCKQSLIKTGKVYPDHVNKKKGRSGGLNGFYGMQHSDTTKAILSASATARFADPAERQKNSDIMKTLWANPQYHQEHLQYSIAALNMRPTSIERKVDEALQAHVPGRWIYCGDGKTFIAGKVPDFLAPKRKMLIEACGMHWHTPEEINAKVTHYAKSGYRTLVLWENEINSMSLREIADRVLKFESEL